MFVLLVALIALCLVSVLAYLATCQLVLWHYTVLISICHYDFSLWLTARKLRGKMVSGQKIKKEEAEGCNRRYRSVVVALYGLLCIVALCLAAAITVKALESVWPLSEMAIYINLAVLIAFAAIVGSLQQIADFEDHVGFFVGCDGEILVDGDNPALLPVSDESDGMKASSSVEDKTKSKCDPRKGKEYCIGVRITQRLGLFLRDASKEKPICYVRMLSK